MWGCPAQPDNPEACVISSQRLLTRPTSISPTEIICATPEDAEDLLVNAGDAMFGLALNVYDVVAATCADGLQNGDEDGIDCGGASCAACIFTCADGVQNRDESGVDCGGMYCGACLPSCTTFTAGQECQLPVVSSVSPAALPSEHATMLTVRGAGFVKAGQIFVDNRVVLGTPVTYTHNAQPRCSFGHAEGDQRFTTATVVDSATLHCATPRAPIVGCYSLQVSLDLCDYHSAVQASCPAERASRSLSVAFVPLSQYPGCTSIGCNAEAGSSGVADGYAYPGDFVKSGLAFKFFTHAEPVFSVPRRRFHHPSPPPSPLAPSPPPQSTTQSTSPQSTTPVHHSVH